MSEASLDESSGLSVASSSSSSKKSSASSSVISGSSPFSSCSISLRISSERIGFVAPRTSSSSSFFFSRRAFSFSASSWLFSRIFAFSRWVASQLARISSIFILPVICESSEADSGATAPLATATPAFRASEREAPEMVVEISEVLRIRVFGCDSASGSEACVRAIGSGRSGRSILSVTCTSLRTLSAIRGFGAGRSLDFRKEGFLLEESLRPIPSFR